jgi:hypothetical protein
MSFGGAIQINLGSNASQANTSGNITFLAGSNINITDSNNFIPIAGNKYTILTWGGTITGTPSLTIDTAFANNGITLIPIWSSNNLTLLAVGKAHSATVQSITFNPGSIYGFVLYDANGGAGTGTNLTNILSNAIINAGTTVNSALNIQICNDFNCDNQTLSANFDPTHSYSWIMLHTAAGITGFDPAKIIIDTSEFYNARNSKNFYITQNGNDLIINYNPNRPTAYTFSGSASGNINTTSTNFTITPNNPYTGTITITPSGGGIIAPVVLTFNNSSTPQTFTITPTAAGTVTLTSTNNGGLADPTALSYVVSALANDTIPSTATAPTDVQSTIQALIQQIAGLKAQLAQMQSSGTTWCHTFNFNMMFGDTDASVAAANPTASNSEVTDLNIVLAKEGVSDVVAFQQKYASDILTPVGLTKGTGYVGARTRAKLNALYGCPVNQ